MIARSQRAKKRTRTQSELHKKNKKARSKPTMAIPEKLSAAVTAIASDTKEAMASSSLREENGSSTTIVNQSVSSDNLSTPIDKLVADLKNKIKELETSLAEKQGKVNSLEKLKLINETVVATLSEKITTSILDYETLEDSSRAELSTIQDEHRTTIEKIQTAHEQEIVELQKSYAKKYKKLNAKNLELQEKQEIMKNEFQSFKQDIQKELLDNQNYKNEINTCLAQIPDVNAALLEKDASIMILKEWNQVLQTSNNNYINERISASTINFIGESNSAHNSFSQNQTAPIAPPIYQEYSDYREAQLSPHREYSIYSAQNSHSRAYQENNYNENNDNYLRY